MALSFHNKPGVRRIALLIVATCVLLTVLAVTLSKVTHHSNPRTPAGFQNNGAENNLGVPASQVNDPAAPEAAMDAPADAAAPEAAVEAPADAAVPEAAIEAPADPATPDAAMDAPADPAAPEAAVDAPADPGF